MTRAESTDKAASSAESIEYFLIRLIAMPESMSSPPLFLIRRIEFILISYVSATVPDASGKRTDLSKVGSTTPSCVS